HTEEQTPPAGIAHSGNGHSNGPSNGVINNKNNSVKKHRKQQQRKKKQQQQQQQCRVCHRRASGHHYGALTCEACKAFFKRTVNSCLTYFCPVQRSGSRCPVRVRNKRQCPACRWKRCLEASMQIRLVRSASPVQPPLLPSSVITAPADNAASNGANSSASNAAFSMASRQPPAYIQQLIAESAAKESEAAAALAAAAEAGLGREIVQQLRCTCIDELVSDIDMSDSSLAGVASQSERHALLLGICFNKHANDLVAFAKHLTGFAALPMPDRVQMLQLRWLNLVAWQIVYQSTPYDGHLKLCRNFWIRDDAPSLFAGRIPVRSGRLLRCFANLLTRLGLTEAEFLLLKVVFLLEAPPSYSWEDRPAIDRLQERYIAEFRSVCPSATRRARLLSLDGLLEAVRVLTVGYWLRVLQRTPYTPPPLVTEMLTFSLGNVPHVSSDLSDTAQPNQANQDVQVVTEASSSGCGGQLGINSIP
ncbi:hypothetical protein BOX15_Mlig033935g1, partial [Macrostomum lignano]